MGFDAKKTWELALSAFVKQSQCCCRRYIFSPHVEASESELYPCLKTCQAQSERTSV